MIGPFASVQRKMRVHAANWMELAKKVVHYRRDVLHPNDLAEIGQASGQLRTLLQDKADASKLKLGIEHLEGVLRRTGGTFYPKSTLVEYVEFFLVAAIVILGIRAYFVQPFKIPTNSMWPSYHGMTGEVYRTPGDEPGVFGGAFRFVTQLAKPVRVDAPTSGDVGIPLMVGDGGRSMVPFRVVPGRKWLVIPTQLREYELYVGRTPVTVRVPGDFDFDRVLRDAYFDGAERFPVERYRPGDHTLLPTGKHVERGERVLAFDILTGDQLFVDRMSYHFVRPKIGDGFVFRTDHLQDLHWRMPGPKEQYYIKRLVGVPGDTLEIREPILYRNGQPISGAAAFQKNAEREGNYPGYRNTGPDGRMEPGESMTVPADSFMAFGDNSASSLDSRYWGAIPEADVVGRPLFIYYPFTRRWGPAR